MNDAEFQRLLFEKFEAIFRELGERKFQVGHVEGQVESEKDTLKRARERLEESIEEAKKEFRAEINGNGKEGLKIRVDRLEREKKLLIGFVAFIGSLLVPLIIEYVKNVIGK